MDRVARDAVVDAAFDLFDERGFDQTTVDDIAARAGVSRTTFFRRYKSKEEVIFPDHDKLLAAISQRLATSTEATAVVAVSDAVRLVLHRYLAEGDHARRRYALTSRISALRDREIASVARYQRLFREFIAEWMGPGPDTDLRAELMAAAVVSAHNHVLRRWLRGEADDPVTEVDDALAQVISLFAAPGEAGSPVEQLTGSPGTTIVVLQTPAALADVLPALKRAIALD